MTETARGTCHLLALHQLQQRVRPDNGVKFPRILIHLSVPAAQQESARSAAAADVSTRVPRIAEEI